MRLQLISSLVSISLVTLITLGCSNDGGTSVVPGASTQTNVIYTVNGRGQDVVFSVTGDLDDRVTDKNVSLHLLNGYDRYEVSYAPNNNDSTTAVFLGGGVYLYAATHCTSPQGELHHTIGAHKFSIVNLGSNSYLPSAATSLVVTQSDGVTAYEVTENINACSISETGSLDNVTIENGMNITLTRNGSVDINYTFSNIDPELLLLGDKLKLDIIIYDTSTLSIVPIADYDNLLRINSIEKCNGIDDDHDGLTDEGNVCAVEEICDGIDNDLDGLTDENGVCEEICGDGIDNDYDGLTDEECPADETCDAIDNDLDGETDEGLTQECSLQSGICAGAIVQCTGGTYPVCGSVEYGSNYEVDETTCDGLDNDCDGETDEGSACTEVCGNFLDDDNDGQTDEECELCSNGLDDDLDGLTDEPDCQ